MPGTLEYWIAETEHGEDVVGVEQEALDEIAHCQWCTDSFEDENGDYELVQCWFQTEAEFEQFKDRYSF